MGNPIAEHGHQKAARSIENIARSYKLTFPDDAQAAIRARDNLKKNLATYRHNLAGITDRIADQITTGTPLTQALDTAADDIARVNALLHLTEQGHASRHLDTKINARAQAAVLDSRGHLWEQAAPKVAKAVDQLTEAAHKLPDELTAEAVLAANAGEDFHVAKAAHRVIADLHILAAIRGKLDRPTHLGLAPYPDAAKWVHLYAIPDTEWSGPTPDTGGLGSKGGTTPAKKEGQPTGRKSDSPNLARKRAVARLKSQGTAKLTDFALMLQIARGQLEGITLVPTNDRKEHQARYELSHKALYWGADPNSPDQRPLGTGMGPSMGVFPINKGLQAANPAAMAGIRGENVNKHPGLKL